MGGEENRRRRREKGVGHEKRRIYQERCRRRFFILPVLSSCFLRPSPSPLPSPSSPPPLSSPPPNRDIRIHLTGCPNTCGQIQVGDIGLLGTQVKNPNGPGKVPAVDIYVGGRIGADSHLAGGLSFGALLKGRTMGGGLSDGGRETNGTSL
jgi:hypothetical protein